ncbi:putative reverse transcriptase domain, ribonuclease H-like domain, aspartic peptidase domain protein, partial [Tanacetum coccineum]
VAAAVSAVAADTQPLQCLYKSSHTAKDIFGNATGKVTEPEIVPTRLLLMVFNPLGNLSHPTACAGDIEQHNNLPPWTEGFMDLKGVETIAFVQARSYKACPTCNEDTPYVRVLSKIAYVGHRRFLKCPINGGVALEFNAKHDNTDPPKEWPDSIEGGPIRPRWMYPFERYMKKLKGYVRNKAKPEGSIAEGYVAEEALTFSSHYFRDVTTKFNRPDRNVDPLPQRVGFQCIDRYLTDGLRSFIRFDAQELKKVKWYVLHNSPEIDTYRSQFKSLFPNKDMQEEFPDWFGSQIRQRHVDNDQDPEVSTTSELFALANGPSWTPISINSCVVDGVRYVVHSRDERRTTQNSGICSPGPDGEMYYGQLQEIIEFKYLLFKVALFRVKWFDTSNKGRKVNKLVLRNNMTQIDCSREAFKDDQYILEDDPDIIHFDNSSDLPLSTSLNDLNNATLHIDGQSTVVDAPPDIIDVPDEDDDIIGDEDALPHDLMSADVARSHGGDGGGDDRPPSHVVPTGCGGCFANKGKGKRKPNLGGRGAGRLNTRDKTRNLSLKEIAVAKGPVPINFEQGDKQTLNPLGPHAAHWSNYIGEVVRSVPLYYPSWEKVPKERKAAIISEIGTLFDLRPHMDSSRWTEIYEGINMHLQKAYNTNKASFKAKHWKADPTTGTYDVEAIRRARPEEITAAEWDKYIKFWNDPKNLARAAQNRLNRQKSVVTSRQGSRSLARLRDEMRQASDTQEYPSLIDTFWRTHTVDGVFPKDEDRRIYEEMKRLEATGEYTEDEINALARGGKLRGHIPGVGRVLPSRATSRPSMPAPDKSLKSIHKKVDFMMSLFRSDSKYSDMFKEFESGGASGSGGCGDDEESGDDEDGEDEDDDGER